MSTEEKNVSKKSENEQSAEELANVNGGIDFDSIFEPDVSDLTVSTTAQRGTGATEKPKSFLDRIFNW